MRENIRNAVLVVGAGSTLISEALIGNVQRKAIVMTNTSTAGQTITLSWGNEAAAGKGIVLYPSGAWAETMDAAFRPSNERIFAIASAAAGALSVHERIVSD